MTRLTVGAALASALALAGAAPAAVAPGAASAPTAPVYDDAGRLVDVPFAPGARGPRLTAEQATRLGLAHPKVARWLERYPPHPAIDAEFEPRTGTWTVKAWSGRAGQIAEAVVDDRTGRVVEAWTGPQVAWRMARGGASAFGGKTLNEPWVWLSLSALFLLGLVDWRRPLQWRTLDLLALLSFTVSLRCFNDGEIFRSVPLAYPPLVYLLGRMLWIGFGRRAPASPRVAWPPVVLAAATVFLVGFRVGLNVEAERSVIDVGYAGVIGAHRILHGEAPYGHMPTQADRPPCGPADASGEIRERIQTNGRCEASNDRGDTYGPVSYLAYVPGVFAFGWSGKWDELWAAHATSLLFDLLALVGLALVGRRLGGARLAAALPFAWAAYPFTQYVSNSNTNDAIAPALLVWGFWLLTSPAARGAAAALAGWTKFAALVVAPLWLAYPSLRAPGRVRFVAGFALATLAAFWVLLLEPDLVEAMRTFWDRTLGFQLGRESPFSLWGWGQYHAAGIPDLAWLQRILQGMLLGLALLVVLRPREKDPVRLAALTAALLVGVELVLTHWFYLYIPWFFPFVALALLLPREPPAVH